MQQLAMSWLVYRMTGSTLWLGVVGFSSQIPSFFFSIFAGVFVDRVNQLRLLKVTQALSALQALILSVLTLSGKINLTEIIFLSLVLGIINALDMPTRQAFVVRMIGDKRDLPNAIALNSSVMNGTRLIGPALARCGNQPSGRRTLLLIECCELCSGPDRALSHEGGKRPPSSPR